MAEQAVELVRRWFEQVWNQRREETIDELIAPDGLCQLDDGSILGPDEFRERQYRPLVSAFPDVRVSLEDLISDGDQVVVRWSATGTHLGAGIGIPPTGERLTFQGLSWIRVRDGKLAQGWQSSNIERAIQQLMAKAAAGRQATDKTE